MTLEDKIRSLTRNQVKILYWRCQGEQFKQIAMRYDRSIKWAQGLMTGVYRKLEVPQGSTPPEIADFLKNNKVCETLQKLIVKPEDLETWPLHGANVVETKEGHAVYEVKDKDESEEHPDPGRMADVESETAAEEKQETNRGEEVFIGEEVPETEQEPVSTEPERPERQPISHNAWLRIFWIGVIILCFWFIFFRPRFQQNTPQNSTTTTPDTSPTFTLQSALTPEPTVTAGILPTAVPLPIKEDFSKQYSDQWWVSGNPLLVETVWSPYSGVITTKKDEFVTLMIGNTAWKNYVISLRSYADGGAALAIGVRASDLNNMIQLECSDMNCHWLILEQGVRDQIPGDKAVSDNVIYTFTVQDDTFTVQTKSLVSEVRFNLVLPSKYKGKFQSGGVMLQFSEAEIDYIEINPLP